jgi:sterol carrier protein 2
MSQVARVVGVGMSKFYKPGSAPPYTTLGATAVRAALTEAELAYSSVQQAYVGYVYGDSTCGQAMLYGIGMSGVPIVNVNNNCATGSTALFLARQAVDSGAADCVLAVGFEQMQRGALAPLFPDRPGPLDEHTAVLNQSRGRSDAPLAAQLFGAAAAEYIERYGARIESFAKVSEKARRHGANNENAVFQTPVTLEEVMASPEIYAPLTRLQCCPPTCGAAAAVVCSAEFARLHGCDDSVAIAAQTMSTDTSETFEERNMIDVVGFGMARRAALAAYEHAGIGPEDVDVVELHDCFTINEILSYEALGLAAQGCGERLVWDADNTYGGKYVINPSGGLLSKGHPLGATGLAQCAELVWQLRGRAGKRQVEGARIGLQHNLGLGGACVVTVYRHN